MREPGEAVAAPQHFPVGHRRLAFRIRLLPPAALGIEAAERQVDGAFVLGRSALDHGPIGLFDLAVLEQQPERGGRLAMPSQHEAAGGILVEPMRQHRRPRQAEAQRVERGFQIGAALGAAMHRQPGRLVDDQHQPVAMEHAGLDFFGGQFGNIHQSVKTFVYAAKRLTHPRMNDTTHGNTQAELVAAAVRRTEANLEFARDRGRRSRHQAQARPRHARGHRGRAAARRSRHRGRRAHRGGGRRRPL